MSKEASKPDNGKAEQSTSAGTPAVSNASKNEKKPNDVKESASSSTTDTGKKASAKTKSTSKPKRERPPFSKTALLGLVIALAASGAAGYEFYLLRLQAKQNATFLQAQNNASTRISGLEQELQATRQAMAGEVSAREKVESEQSALKTVMDSISARLGRTSTAWRLAEVEYLLTVANHRLTLAQDRKTAIAIFVFGKISGCSRTYSASLVTSSVAIEDFIP